MHRPVGATTPGLATVLREWGRIGCIGFGGPPTHIALLRDPGRRPARMAQQRGVRGRARRLQPPPRPRLDPACDLLRLARPGTAGRAGRRAGFIVPGLVVILALAAVFLGSPPLWVRGAGQAPARPWPQSRSRRGRACCRQPATGRLAAPLRLAALPPRRRARRRNARALARARARRLRPRRPGPRTGLPTRSLQALLPVPLLAAIGAGGTASLVWVAFKVGALSFGGGFVIVPLMQADAVSHYHWMTQAGFLNAVALGQVTPGPVVQTVAVIGYAAAGVPGGLLASLVAFSPSLAFVLARRTRVSRASARTGGPGVPRRRRAGGDRRDPRLRDPARARPRASRGSTASPPAPRSCSCCSPGAAS